MAANIDRQQIITVFGVKGSGKTSWVRWYMQNHQSRDYLVMDHFHEHSTGPGVVVVYSLEQLAHADDKAHVYLLRGKIDYDDFWDFAASCRGMTIVFDEVDKCCTAGEVPEGLNDVIQYGRHLDVSLIAAARRPARVSRSLTSQSDFIVSYKLREPRDLRYLEEFAGEAYARTAARLEVGQYVIFPQEDWIAQTTA